MSSSNLGSRLQVQEAAERAGVPAQGSTTAEGPVKNVLSWINRPSTMAEIARALPAGLDAPRFMRQVQTELRKNPALLEADPRSFILGVLYFAQLGLELGPLGLAYLTGPFNVKHGSTTVKEVVPVIGYKGLAQLAYRSDKVELIDAVAVHEGEPFEVSRGTNPSLEHKELASCAGAPIIAYYAIAVIRGASRVPFDVMWPADIEAIKKRSPSASAAISPWKSDYEAMAKKTVTRRLLNRGKVPLETRVAQAIAEDELRELGLDKPALLEPALLATLPPEPVDEPAAGGQEAQEPAGAAGAATAAAGEVKADAPPQAAPAPNTGDPGAAFRPKA